jgi:hypothetical protein
MGQTLGLRAKHRITILTWNPARLTWTVAVVVRKTLRKEFYSKPPLEPFPIPILRP